MEILKYVGIALLSITAITILIFAIKSKKPLKTLFLNAILGIAALVIINMTSKFTGVHIFVNQWTVCGSVIYGLPAVFAFIIFQLIFI